MAERALLAVDDLAAGYHKKTVLEGVSFHVGEGERVGIVGRNGAGKTTLLQTLLGVLPARRGRIEYGGRDVARDHALHRVRSGIALVPQGGRFFSNLTVRENLDLGGYVVRDPAALAASLDLVYQTFPRLRERAAQRAGTLSGGERQMLAVGRALMAGPRLLMLDEPSSRLAPILVRELMDKVHEICTAFGTSPARRAEHPRGLPRGRPGLRAEAGSHRLRGPPAVAPAGRPIAARVPRLTLPSPYRE